MPFGLYLDEHIPRQIAVALRLRGIDILTIQEDQRRGEVDTVLIDRAAELDRVIFSFDTDMLRESTRLQ